MGFEGRGKSVDCKAVLVSFVLTDGFLLPE